MKKYSIFLSVTFLISCQSMSKDQTKNQPTSNKYKQDFSIALKHLENSRYEQALKGFQALAQYNQARGSTQGMAHWSVLFNMGSSYERLQKCKEAQAVFLDLKSKVQNDPAFQTRILLRLHYIYECLSQPQKALMTLKEVEKKSHRLGEISQLVEVPARFSILYAQTNKNEQSIRYQDIAFKGIKKIKASMKDSAVLNQKGAELFFIMGRSFVAPAHIQMKFYLKALPLHQIYLIQSFLLSDSFWSSLARQELVSLYKKLSQAYRVLSDDDKRLYKSKMTRALSNLQKIAIESASDTLSQLKIQIIDDTLAKMKN